MFGWLTRNAQTSTAPEAADETRSLANPSPWLLELFGAVPAAAGVSVSPQSAMRCTAVRAAVEAISESIGGLPVHVYQRDGDARQRARRHPAYALLHDQANDWTPASGFREQITRDALLHGNGFAFINRDRDGRPVELIRLRPEAVTVELDRTTAEPTYRVSADTNQRTYDRRDILHIAAPSLDGVSGASPVTQCHEAIALNLAIERQIARFYSNEARPSAVLAFSRSLTAEAAARMRASWQAMTSSGGTAVLDQDAKYQTLTMTSADAQTLEIWQHSVLEICRAFRVPPHLVFELGRATWGNADTMGASFLRFTLDRWIKVWQGEIRLKLIAPEDRETYYAEFLTDDLLRTDLAARADAYGKLIAPVSSIRMRFGRWRTALHTRAATVSRTPIPAPGARPMREAPTLRQFFGDEERTFALTPPMIVELERITGRGIGGLCRSLFASDFRHVEVLQTIRLALIGGGTDPEDAAALIAAYAAPRPVMEPYALAVAILEATMFGPAKPVTDGETAK